MKNKQRKLRAILTIIFLVGLCTSAQAAGIVGKLVVSELKENALFRSSQQSPWQELKQGQTLYPNFEIKTLSQTRLTIRLGDGSEVRVAPNSLFRINDQTDAKLAQFDFQLVVGRAWARLRKNFRRGARLLIRTAHAKIDIEGTSYGASVTDTDTQVQVFTGKVSVASNQDNFGSLEPMEIAPPHEVSREQWQVIVAAFHEITVRGGHQPGQPTPFDPDASDDEWVQWNLEQDRNL